jgi:hypothetical protein
MDDNGREAAYARLSGVSHASRIRDLAAVETHLPAGRTLTPAHWAPFIHVGV